MGQPQLAPVTSVLDKVFVCTDWEKQCSSTSWLKVETRIGSKHTPLFFSSREDSPRPPPRFFFELGWFEHGEFSDQLKAKWEAWSNATTIHRGSLYSWQGFSTSSVSFCAVWVPIEAETRASSKPTPLMRLFGLTGKQTQLALAKRAGNTNTFQRAPLSNYTRKKRYTGIVRA